MPDVAIQSDLYIELPGGWWYQSAFFIYNMYLKCLLFYAAIMQIFVIMFTII